MFSLRRTQRDRSAGPASGSGFVAGGGVSTTGGSRTGIAKTWTTSRCQGTPTGAERAGLLMESGLAAIESRDGYRPCAAEVRLRVLLDNVLSVSVELAAEVPPV